MNKPVEAILFDMDGVIFDSERLVIECWQQIASRHSIPDIVEICMRCQGVNRVESGKLFVAKYGEDFPYETYKKEVTALFRELYGEGRLPLKPGAREIISALCSKGIPLAVASSTRTDIVRLELSEAKLLQYFSAVLGGDQVERSKPEPDIFLAAAKALHAEPARCFVLEDSHNGIRAAYRAGMRPIMIPDMQPPTDEIKQMAEIVLPDLLNVLAYIVGIPCEKQ